MTADDFRRLALDLHGAIERAHMGHPDFRANGKIFATLDAKEEMGTVKLTPDEQREVMRGPNVVFEPAAGAWGRQGWTRVHLDRADAPAVRGALLLAWQSVVDAPPRKAASKKTTGQARKRVARTGVAKKRR